MFLHRIKHIFWFQCHHISSHSAASNLSCHYSPICAKYEWWKDQTKGKVLLKLPSPVSSPPPHCVDGRYHTRIEQVTYPPEQRTSHNCELEVAQQTSQTLGSKLLKYYIFHPWDNTTNQVSYLSLCVHWLSLQDEPVQGAKADLPKLCPFG